MQNSSRRGLVSALFICFAFFTLGSVPAHAIPPMPPAPPGIQLAWFRFDDTNNWTGPGTNAPLSFGNIVGVPSWQSNALWIDSEAPAWLSYPVVEPSGQTNLACTNASLSVWVWPDWSSVNQGGTGPGDWGRIIDVGQWSTNAELGWFSLYFSPDGNSLNLSGQSGGNGADFATAPISWDTSGFHLICVTWSATNSAIYLDGQLASTNGAGVTYYPGSDALANGLFVGSDSGSGMQQVRAVVDSLRTWDYPLDADTASNMYQNASPLVWPLAASASGGGFSGADSDPSFPGFGGTNSGGGGTPDYIPYTFDTNGLWLSILPTGTNAYNADPNSATLILHNTTNDGQTVYEILSETDLACACWSVEASFFGAAGTNTPITIPMAGRPTLFFSAINSTQMSDNDGLPDWWQLKFFGHLGVDPNADPMGDGWSNIEKYENGMNPNVFYTPPAVNGVTATVSTNGNVMISWVAATNLPGSGAGAVTGYTISWNYGFQTINVGSSTTNYSMTAETNVVAFFSDPAYFDMPTLSVQVDYANASSLPSQTQFPYNSNLTMEASIVRGSGGKLNLVVSSIAPNVRAIRVFASADEAVFGACYPYLDSSYLQSEQEYNYAAYNYFFDVPTSAITNGVYVIPDAQVPLYSWYQFLTCAVGNDGTLGPPPPDHAFAYSDSLHRSVPFLDGRAQLQQNLAFWLQAASQTEPMSFIADSAVFHGGQSNAVVAGFHHTWYYFDAPNPSLDEFQPFEDNIFYRNLLFATTNVNSDGSPAANTSYNEYSIYDDPYVASSTAPAWDVYGFVSAGNTNPPAAALSYPFSSFYPYQYYSSTYDLGGIGVSQNNSTSPRQFQFSAGQTNLFGMTFESVQVAYADASSHLTFATLSPTSPLPITSSYPYYFYPATSQPGLRTVDYYFARPWLDPLPDYQAFAVTNTTQVLFAGVGQPFTLTAWAKQGITNGSSSAFGYVEQYFDKSYLADTNGNPTTNQTGILSEYGEFFPTDPGQVILTTKPDGATGSTGQCTVNVIKLQLDANHDGTMDSSFTGPDNATAAGPFTFWVNNNYDRTHTVDCGLTTCDVDEDDLLAAGAPGNERGIVPDCAYGTYVPFVGVVPSIPCEKDLEDYARLWTPGLSNVMAVMPTNYTVKLTLIGDAQIRLFRAYESNGGTNYLFDLPTAQAQATNSASLYVGLLTSSSPIILTNRAEHFIWCGAASGNAQIDLQVFDGNANLIADTSAYLRIMDIKQMYERWTVGDAPSLAPTATASCAEDNLPVGAIPFQYDRPTDTNTPYILFVHGWNMDLWEKNRFAETAFKRLYWQGYAGRFGLFRWPTYFDFPAESFTLPAFDPKNYDNSEYNAWRSAQGLLNKLNDLNAEYPGHVYMLAHSMGNVVAGQALRLAGTSQVVNTYVASQAAVPSHTYDDSIADYSFVNGITWGPFTPNIYKDWFLSSGSVSRRINFYNTNDYALQRNRWELNQLIKTTTSFGWTYGFDGYPHSGWPTNATPSYTAGVDDSPPWNYFYKVSMFNSDVSLDIVNVLSNRYEGMAYAAQARSTALGRTAGVGNLDRNVDLTRIVNPLWLSDPSGHSYGDHKWHSAEFRSTLMEEKGYWRTLLYTADGFNLPVL